MKQYSLYIFDLDGTLNRGNDPIPYAAESVAQLKSRGSKIRFVTNNATQTLDHFVEKLTRLGFDPKRSDIETSATAAADLCRQKNFMTVGALGEPGMIQCLKEAGIDAVGPEEIWPNELDASGKPVFGAKMEKLDAVVMGLFRTCNYQHIAKGMQAIMAGAEFIATNRDVTFPLEEGRFNPGSGAMVSALAACTGIEPIVTGKPNPYTIEILMKAAVCQPNETLVVGDRLDTDIESGKRAGADTFLVMTGVEKSAPKGQLWGEDLRALL